MPFKSELGPSGSQQEASYLKPKELPPVSGSELGESKPESVRYLALRLIEIATTARNNLALAETPSERQMIFAANRQYWQHVRGCFAKDKQRRHQQELADGAANIRYQESAMGDYMDNLADDFTFGMEALWQSAAQRDAEVNGYDSGYCSQADAIDWSKESLPESGHDSYRSQLLPVAASFTVSQFGQDYKVGNPDWGQGSSWSEIFPRLPSLSSDSPTNFDDLSQDLSVRHQTVEGMRNDLRDLLKSENFQSSDSWSNFAGFTKGFLKHLSDTYNRAHEHCLTPAQSGGETSRYR